MNISVELTGSILEYIEKKVNMGLYKSRSEVIREAIRKMISDDIREQLKVRGLTEKELEKARNKVARELIGKKYKGKI